jgi:hypothetical protein
MVQRAAIGALSALVLAANPALAQNIATVPLHKRPDQSGFANFIAVSVGGGPAGDVLLDTGSTGLRIRAAAVGPDVRLTNTPVSYSYTSGPRSPSTWCNKSPARRRSPIAPAGSRPRWA